MRYFLCPDGESMYKLNKKETELTYDTRAICVSRLNTYKSLIEMFMKDINLYKEIDQKEHNMRLKKMRNYSL